MNRLISGNAYSLKQIFSGDNDKTIIPDLQRDYCWGNPYSKDSDSSLVDSFMDSILKLNKSKDITMGLIYGYYNELVPYHLQLCDGQQRLTTLFLIVGIINKLIGDNRFRDVLISNFELNEDDKEPHLLYGIRESSLYFLSDLTIHYFLKSELQYNDIVKQYWFLNSYYKDPTINSILKAIKTIESRLNKHDDIETLGYFLQDHLKFLFYDMRDRLNGEETFVVINTTGEPLSANQNLKPLIILENPNYYRSFQNNEEIVTHDTAQDWEEMETWFWKKRHLNGTDTSTEGMIAFLHCVRVLECSTESDWHHTIDIGDDKFPVSIKMTNIWDWFCAYKRIYEIDYSRLCVSRLDYPERQAHYTQKELYSLLPTMVYCRKFKDAQDTDIQRVFHLFNNMGRYRTVIRSSQKDPLNVPAFRTCQLVKSLPSKDIISFLNVPSFNIDEELVKLSYIQKYTNNNVMRQHIEELFAYAESFPIYDGQISTLVKWSDDSIEKLDYLFNKIKKLWIESTNRNKLRRALLAYEIKDYPMSTGTANLTLCSGTEWRTLFEKQGEQIVSFLNSDSIDDIIRNYKDIDSPYYIIIHNEAYLNFSKDHNIRTHAQNVIELMAKTKASASFLLFHRGEVFEKEMVDMDNWNGFWVWSDGDVSVFYSICNHFNITLDMRITDVGYQIVAWLDRRPSKPSVKTSVLTSLGFERINEEWLFPVIGLPKDAKNKFIELSQRIIALSKP